MRADDPFPARITRLMQPLGPVRARAMFGGCGIFLDDAMLAIVDGERLYFKVDDQSAGRFAAAGGEPFTYRREGRTVALSFREAPPGSLDDSEALLDWARLALSSAQRARKKRTRRRRA
ncbi:MAG TPA: TfoX/Sxy family protein [Kiloniellales bacterium]